MTTIELFFYLDPPYPTSNQGHYSGYTEKDFDNLMNTLFKLKGKFMLSCYKRNLDNYKLPSNWNVIYKKMPIASRKVKYSKEKRIMKIEAIVMNYNNFKIENKNENLLLND
jgi:DNA adenine methylase